MPAAVSAGSGFVGSVPGGGRPRPPASGGAPDGVETGQFDTALAAILGELVTGADRVPPGSTPDPSDTSTRALSEDAAFTALVPPAALRNGLPTVLGQPVPGQPVLGQSMPDQSMPGRPEPGWDDAGPGGPEEQQGGRPMSPPSASGSPLVSGPHAEAHAGADPTGGDALGLGPVGVPATTGLGPLAPSVPTGGGPSAAASAPQPPPAALASTAGLAEPSPEEPTVPGDVPRSPDGPRQTDANTWQARSGPAGSLSGAPAPVARTPVAPGALAGQQTPAPTAALSGLVLQPLTGPSRPDASAAAPGAQGLAPQLARPILTLAGASPGQHVLTIRVTPENLGPVTVQAHIGADGVRIELFAPTDVGRAAVQAVLADLRKDLAGTGLGASLDLSDRGAPSHDPAAREDRNHGGAQAGRSQGTGPASHLAADEPRPVRPALPTALSAIRLDIFA